jgi:molybdopterin/thiamine biosynthesis adenylyltransferase
MRLSTGTDSRFHRQGLITWWDQEKLSNSKVLVVGAGALGNEIVKNLALVGVGSIVVCDMDSIENSNLSRCIFFRPSDLGKSKAEVLASRAQEIYEDVSVAAENKAIQRLGLAFLGSFDLVIGALDNREARAWVNQACRKLGKTWIDGAIEGLRGLVRMFASDGPCYYCTLSESDFVQMSHRRSCALLSPEDLLAGKTPTNATTASIIAGVQVQEAVKFLVGKTELNSLVGKAWMFTGDVMDSYITKYAEDEYCLAHDTYGTIESLVFESLSSLIEQLAVGSDDFEDLAIDFEDELVTLQACSACPGGTKLIQFRSSLPEGAGRCSHCSGELSGGFQTSASYADPVMQLNTKELEFARDDVVTVRWGTSRRHFLVRGDGQ